MRSSNVMTISLPAKMAWQTKKYAKKTQMTNSELVRAALRKYLEEASALEAIRIADEKLKAGKLKVLPPGGLAKLMAKV